MIKTAGILLSVLGIGATIYTLLTQNADLSRNLALSRQNMAAVTESLAVAKNDLGFVEQSRALMVAEMEDVESVNDSLSRRLRRVEGELSIAISTQVSETNTDTAEASVGSVDRYSVIGDLEAPFVYDPPLPPGNRLLVEGIVRCSPDSIRVIVTRRQLAVDLTVAVRKREDGVYEAVAVSTWPGLRVDVEGAILKPEIVIPKRSNWMIPAGIGAGVATVLVLLLR